MAPVEKTVVAWLNADPALADWPASMDVPFDSDSADPSTFVTVERVGGVEEWFRSRPLVAVQVWGRSSYQVADAASSLVLPRLQRLPLLDMVACVDVTGMSDFPAPDGRARYQILIQPTIQVG
ncbi:hypothetical protein DSM100688_0390 [Bifidobacterium ramosum]|uniref:Uncharacterized protein n=1 Tax=Bifidobacterium ramosum TaxID=1798158 RepID=A0A6L4X305_9BIFI|nr:hypothetical protein [Bifidobacterium ramosum]KAB8289310.1 hypothetical protein DSM100688_0390 [Bifidobacterium ramosum]NEG71014.1 hypothetical protein [Bifidobacterium ramosum]